MKQLAGAAEEAAQHGLAPGFSVDYEFSLEGGDERMGSSFTVCWDRVHRGAWETSDEDAVAGHGSVLYVLSPPMTADTAVEVSADALALVGYMLDHGAIAAKGESAGVAHGVTRWRELVGLAAAARKNAARLELCRQCRLALSKRPLESNGLETVGFHLVGLPEVWAPYDARIDDARAVVAVIDHVADEMAAQGVEVTIAACGAKLSYVSSYEEDDFKFNPYGTILLPQSLTRLQ